MVTNPDDLRRENEALRERGAVGLGRARVAAGDRGRGARGGGEFVEFFAERIANERTRAAYARAAGQFLGWCEARGFVSRRSRRSTSLPTSGRTRVQRRP